MFKANGLTNNAAGATARSPPLSVLFMIIESMVSNRRSVKPSGSPCPVGWVEWPILRPIDVHEHLAVTATAAVLAQVFEGRGHIEAAHFFQHLDGALVRAGAAFFDQLVKVLGELMPTGGVRSSGFPWLFSVFR